MRFFRFRLKFLFRANLVTKKNQHCQFKLKFGTYTNSNMQISMVIFTFSAFGGITPFGQTWPKKSKCKFKLKFGIYNLGHNILEFYNVLIQIRLTKSNTKRDIQYFKVSIGVASRVAEQSQEIRKHSANLKLGGDITYCPVSLSEIKLKTQNQISNFLPRIVG